MTRIGGLISYYDLDNWWTSEFSDEERKYIISVYNPFSVSFDGQSPDSSTLITGSPSFVSQSSGEFLCFLTGWFLKSSDRSIACRILAKADSLSGPDCPVIQRHFLYGAMIKVYYKSRDLPGYLDAAIDACRKQIAIGAQAAKAFREEYNQRLIDYCKSRRLPLSDDLQPPPGVAGFFMPSHRGYEQLAIILEKQNKYAEAITLCRQATEEGWSDDWQKRIERCTNKSMRGAKPHAM